MEGNGNLCPCQGLSPVRPAYFTPYLMACEETILTWLKEKVTKLKKGWGATGPGISATTDLNTCYPVTLPLVPWHALIVLSGVLSLRRKIRVLDASWLPAFLL